MEDICSKIPVNSRALLILHRANIFIHNLPEKRLRMGIHKAYSRYLSIYVYLWAEFDKMNVIFHKEPDLIIYDIS